MPDLIATSAFGLESLVRYELAQLGHEAKIVGPGRIQFSAGLDAICAANLWLRTADRVLVLVGRFAAPDFEALFECTKAMPWEEWIGPDAEFPVNGRSWKSQLTSVPAIQRAVKRAVVDRLKSAHHTGDLPETGPRCAIEVALSADEATLTIDTTGPSLHKRGYREFIGPAPLKETLAAALVMLSFWRAGRPLIDPFCGSGTIPIEAALIGRNMAPGANRSFAAESWPEIEAEAWSAARAAAREQIGPALEPRIIGTDSDFRALRTARNHARLAGVADDIHFQEQAFDRLTSSREYGCVITNPPYGQRLGSEAESAELHRSIPEVLRLLPTWSHFILTAQDDFETLIQKQADRRRKLYNGRIECTYYQFHGPKPGAPRTTTQPAENHDVAPTGGEAAVAVVPRRQVFGGLTSKAHEQAALFRSRLRKRARHLRRWPRKHAIFCYRLYERDIPEIPLAVDRYEDHLHITEFDRPHDRDPGQHADWLDLMKRTAGEELEVAADRIFLKHKRHQRGRAQYGKVAEQGYEIAVREGGLQFWVNLSDYVDTGLFLDHRQTRAIIREESAEQRVLNLFAYTGSFSVYAAAGGARAVTTVDWSATYLDWARRNFELNDLSGGQYRFLQRDAREYLAAAGGGEEFDLAIVDPPTFSNSKRTDRDWEVQRDHVELLTGVLDRMAPGGRVFFSTNFRRFKLATDELPAQSIWEISRQTVPPDFRNRRIHRCWCLQK